MTLLLGMSRPEGVYMSADYRVTDARTEKLIDDSSVKFLSVRHPPMRAVRHLYWLSQGERCLYVSFQENEDQLAFKADSFGWEFTSAREEGRLTLRHVAPVELNLDRVSDLVRNELTNGSTRRVVIDSLAELEFASAHTTRLPAYTWKLAKLVRSAGASLVITNETASLGLPLAGSVGDLAFLFHNVLILRYVELESEIRRALHILKMRDSEHERAALQFEVDENGFRILKRLTSVRGILGWETLGGG